LELDKIYKKLTGKYISRSRVIDELPDIFLDPNTKKGSFVVNCVYFETTDFAANWQHYSIKAADDSTICISDSKIAFNSDKTLLISKRYLGESLYIKNEGVWTKKCILDSEVSIFSKAEVCEKNKTLTVQQNLYLQQFLNAGKESNDNEIHNDVLQSVLDNKPANITSDVEIIKDNPEFQWLVDIGNVFYKKVNENNWNTLYLIPPLIGILPLDQLNAVAWDENRPERQKA